MEVLLQVFGFYCDFIGALSDGDAREAEPWRRRGGGRREQRRSNSLQLMSGAVDAAVLLSALGTAQLMLAAQESSSLCLQ